jgi:putative flippase GtrA
MPKDTIIAIIDFFYPPFRKVIPLQTFRYAACGGFNVVLGFLVYTFVYHFVLKKQVVDFGFISMEPYSFALLISSIISFTVGFLLNKHVVFVESNLKMHIQLFRYLLSFFLSFCINYVLLKFLVKYMHVNAVFAQMLVTLVIIAFSYLMQRHFTFRVKNAQ